MNRIQICLLFALLLFTNILLGQQTESKISASNDWRGELFDFPLEFAPEIDLKGFEEIKFSPGWADSTANDFWTYHFTWFLEKEYSITEEFLSDSFELYFDGLAKAVLGQQDDSSIIVEPDQSLCLFIKSREGFSGKLRIFDSFFTKDYIILNVKVREKICEKTNEHIVSFDLSPKSFDDDIWQIFQNVEVIKECQ